MGTLSPRVSIVCPQLAFHMYDSLQPLNRARIINWEFTKVKFWKRYIYWTQNLHKLNYLESFSIN